jgi:hypothetical protein
MSTDDRFLYIDGTSAESLREIFESRSTAWKEGDFDHEVLFEEGRLAPMTTGRPIPIVGIKWTETVSRSSPQKSVTKAEGEPCLVVEQLDDDGMPVRPRLVVDRHLNAWDIRGRRRGHRERKLALKRCQYLAELDRYSRRLVRQSCASQAPNRPASTGISQISLALERGIWLYKRA